jgi:small subunit ribosomal protein S35
MLVAVVSRYGGRGEQVANFVAESRNSFFEASMHRFHRHASMAVASRHLCRSLYQVTRSVPAKRKCLPPWRTAAPRTSRAFSTCYSWRVDDRKDDQSPPSNPDTMAPSEDSPMQITAEATASSPSEPIDSPAPSSAEVEEVLGEDADSDGLDLSFLDSSELKTPSQPITVADLDPEARADYEAMPRDQREKWLATENHFAALLENNELDDDEDLTRSVNMVEREIDRDHPMPPMKLDKKDVGFWAEDEDDELTLSEDGDDDYDENNITTVAESQLELHREVREYMRIAAWDMPLLGKFAKKFKQPSLDQLLRFRYTTYMGESHPAQKKVVVEFCIKDLPGLSQQQQDKLIKLVGVRYHPDTDVVRMSCEKFEEAAQNKRYLGDLVGKLVTEAKDETETFADVPFDFRHHKPKKAARFPEEWKLKPERVQELLEARKEAKLLGEGRTIVDGSRLVEEYITVLPQIRGPVRV